MEEHVFEELGELLAPEDAAKFLNTTERSLENWRYADPPKGPSYVRVGGQIRYPFKWLRKWLVEQAVCPTGNCPDGEKPE